MGTNKLSVFLSCIHLCSGCCWCHARSLLLARSPITKMLIINRCTSLFWRIAPDQMGTASPRRLLSYPFLRGVATNAWLTWGNRRPTTCLTMEITLWYHSCSGANCSLFPLRSPPCRAFSPSSFFLPLPSFSWEHCPTNHLYLQFLPQLYFYRTWPKIISKPSYP